MHLTNWGESVLTKRLADLVLVKEHLEYIELCLGRNSEPVRNLASRHQRTDQYR